MGRKQRDKATDAIAIGRIVVGASAWLTPNLSGRHVRPRPRGQPQLPYVGRLFGARDVVLGAGVLRSSQKQKDAWAHGRAGLRRRRRRAPARSPAHAASCLRPRPRWSRATAGGFAARRLLAAAAVATLAPRLRLTPRRSRDERSRPIGRTADELLTSGGSREAREHVGATTSGSVESGRPTPTRTRRKSAAAEVLLQALEPVVAGEPAALRGPGPRRTAGRSRRGSRPRWSSGTL